MSERDESGKPSGTLIDSKSEVYGRLCGHESDEHVKVNFVVVVMSWLEIILLKNMLEMIVIGDNVFLTLSFFIICDFIFLNTASFIGLLALVTSVMYSGSIVKGQICRRYSRTWTTAAMSDCL